MHCALCVKDFLSNFVFTAHSMETNCMSAVKVALERIVDVVLGCGFLHFNVVALCPAVKSRGTEKLKSLLFR